MGSQFTKIAPENTIFVLLSFEGPDLYSLAGGLGVRETYLSQMLADMGFLTHLFFIGDPRKKGEEITHDGRLILHRWCQWISEYYPRGVYQGEIDKFRDFTKSLPGFVMEKIIKPAAADQKMVVILGEEWHTAEAMCRLGELLKGTSLKEKVVSFWNANNTFGFEKIDWNRLTEISTLTTVSRYMRQIMLGRGLNALVIPNGIPSSFLARVDQRESALLRNSLPQGLILTKIARWDPAKRWDTAFGAVRELKKEGWKPLLLARGGIEPYGEEMIAKASSSGLVIKEAKPAGCTLSDYYNAIGNSEGVDILNIKFHCPQQYLRILYNLSDGVLANSSHEPFGLVGLETMAAGGIAITGGTGEDYAIPIYNSVVLETGTPEEIAANVVYLYEHEDENSRLREAARETAREYIWERVTNILIRKLEYQAAKQGIMVHQKQRSFLSPDPVISEKSVPRLQANFVHN